MKRRSVISLAIILVLIAAMAYLELQGAQIGAYDIIPVGDAISLGLDLRGGVYAVYEAEETGQEDFDTLMRGTITILQGRLSEKGFNEATVTQQGGNRIRVEIPNVSEPDEILKIVGTPAVLEFKDPSGNVIMRGEQIKSARAGTYEGSYVVFFEMDETGTKAFAEATTKFVGQQIAIELDGTVISDPKVNTPIPDGAGMITGSTTLEEATNLAMLIQSGALPLNIRQLEVRTISATLGVDALSTSILAGAIGIALVMVFMVIMYRLPGVVACIALSIYIVLTFLLIAVLPGIQLTLPGIAGIILSIGMAVDANCVIFERIKEELRGGAMLRMSVEAGFRNAFTAILDSNITTLIASVVLLLFGTGSIRGFAITLTLGVVLSMFSAIVVTRYLLRLMVKMGVTNKWSYGLKKGGEAV